MSDDSKLIVSTRDAVMTITLNRPDALNTIDRDTGALLREAWHTFATGDARVAVLTATGVRAFCAGIDLKDPPEDVSAIMPGLGVAVDKPIIAAVEGHCIAAGFVLALGCDIIVAGANATFSYTEAKLGLTGGLVAGITCRIALKHAMEIILFGDTMSAPRAHEIGFINEIVDAGAAGDRAVERAAQLAANAPLVLSTLKRLVMSTHPRSQPELAAITRRELAVISGSRDRKEGVRAFLEKRPPQFTGE